MVVEMSASPTSSPRVHLLLFPLHLPREQRWEQRVEEEEEGE